MADAPLSPELLRPFALVMEPRPCDSYRPPHGSRGPNHYLKPCETCGQSEDAHIVAALRDVLGNVADLWHADREGLEEARKKLGQNHENEYMVLRELSDRLTQGNASEWPHINDAIEALQVRALADREGRQQAEETLKREVNEYIEAVHNISIQHEKELSVVRDQLRTAEAERDEARKDAAYHADCRPNRRQAEAATADAKAVNDRNADLIREVRELEAALHDARAQVLREVREELLGIAVGAHMAADDRCSQRLRELADKLAESLP